ncbi:hypothetical protein DY000_02034125 [Brassica cretica]|uniref:RRM domain-containing protein n=1 Tax=Brassica cretica TaxID=69181 RepID=A0ABQ7DGJ0_BRACR|nr:hypothetical protein DY000_02034125 [Brassica cretica]
MAEAGNQEGMDLSNLPVDMDIDSVLGGDRSNQETTKLNSLPEDVMQLCIAPVPRYFYPWLISREVGNAISSLELFHKRCRGKLTEQVVYVLMANPVHKSLKSDDKGSSLQAMRKYGKVKSFREGASRGYAFVEYEPEKDIRRAYEDAHHSFIDGREIIVDYNRQQLMP